MPSRRVVFAGSVAAALTVRYLLPHREADAGEPIAVAAPVRDSTVLREVLREVRQVAPPVAAPPVDDDDDEAPVLASGEDGEPVDADGLTETERFESEVAVIEEAMPRTSGAVAGVVKDQASGELLAGVTVIATSPALVGAQAAITDEHGFYLINGLPPGGYLITFYYADLTLERSGLVVSEQRTTPAFAKLDTRPRAHDETIEIDEGVPVIDQGSIGIGITIDTEYMVTIPVPGRTFEAALGSAAGSQGDPTGDEVGVSFTGTTSVENTYIVEGDSDDDDD